MNSDNKLAVVFGQNGMLGHEVVDAFKSAGWTVATPDENTTFEVNIGENIGLKVFFDKVRDSYGKPMDAVVNAAAFTNVDKCETFEEIAYRTNCLGAKFLAENCIRHKVKMFVHVSTDYVYDQDWHGLLCPGFNLYHPANAYGRTKLAGDLAIEAIYKHAMSNGTATKDIGYLIARTSRLFGKYRYSFVDFVCETCLSSVNGKESPSSPQPLVDMNTTIPTSAKFVAEEIVKRCDCEKSVRSGYVNLVSKCRDTADAPTVYGYAEAIYEILNDLGLKPYKWFARDSKKFYEQCEVPRPLISTMATSVEDAPHWRDALKTYIKEKYIDEKAKTV